MAVETSTVIETSTKPRMIYLPTVGAMAMTIGAVAGAVAFSITEKSGFLAAESSNIGIRLAGYAAVVGTRYIAGDIAAMTVGTMIDSTASATRESLYNGSKTSAKITGALVGAGTVLTVHAIVLASNYTYIGIQNGVKQYSEWSADKQSGTEPSQVGLPSPTIDDEFEPGFITIDGPFSSISPEPLQV